MSDDFQITYAAHTASCTFLLDAEGFCRKIVMPTTSKRKDTPRAAARCVGAQYVASLDQNVSGMLAEMPRVGAAMLFARVDDRGRVSLVRTGVVTRFESHRTEDPFVDGGERESLSVQTSAPAIRPSAIPTPRFPREASREDYDDEPNVKTQQLYALQPQDVELHDVDTTQDYEPRRRAAWPTNGIEMAPATLRQPTAPGAAAPPRIQRPLVDPPRIRERAVRADARAQQAVAGRRRGDR